MSDMYQQSKGNIYNQRLSSRDIDETLLLVVNKFGKELQGTPVPGVKGDVGPQGPQGIQGEQGEQGVQGIQGVTGKDFSIAETFPSVVSMNGDGLTKGDFVMISSTVEDPDNAKLYLWNGTGFTFVTDMSGATGIKGDTGEQGIQGEQGKQGIQGVQGETGAAGKDGANGKDAVINVVTQAEYDALPDKTGVYFIGG